MGARVRSELFEPSSIYGDVLNHFGLHAETKLLELVGELVAVHEVNSRRTVSRGFLDGFARRIISLSPSHYGLSGALES